MLNEKAELSADDSVLGVAVLGFMKCCFTSTKIVGLLGTGAQDVHLDFHTTPELCLGLTDLEGLIQYR